MATIKIGLDCGHGLKTAGKQTPDGIKEWTLNDKVRDKVVSILKDYDVEIIHTDNDEGNTDESLASRVAKYKAAGVAAFVSIHHNAYTGTWNNVTGVEVYTDNNPTSADLALANAIYSRLVKYTGLKGRGIKKAAFYVVNQNTIPAVLVEGGLMDSTIDYKVITSDEGQTAYAKAVAEGLIEFLGLQKKSAVKPAVSTVTIAPKKSYVYNGVDYKLVFDPTYYANTYADLKKAFGTNEAKLLKHFVQYGMKEQRQACAWFNVQTYKNNYVDLQKAYGNNWKSYYLHYINYGYKENRKGVSLNTNVVKASTSTTTTTKPATTSKPATPTTTSKYYPKYTGTSTSIDTVFRAIGVPEQYCGKWSKRKTVAKANGISAYAGTAGQNSKLVTLAKQGKLVKP